MKKKFAVLPSLALMLALGACGTDEETEQSSTGEEVDDNNQVAEPGNEIQPTPFTVLVDLQDAEGESKGTAELEDTDEGVRVKVKAEGLSEGKHGFHFHENGVCEAPDFESAGGHFNPEDTDHGMDTEGGPHAGDLPNLEVGEDGTVDDEFIAKNVTLDSEEENSLLNDSGTSLVIHADKDDGTSQPSGDSGERIACGVIK